MSEQNETQSGTPEQRPLMISSEPPSVAHPVKETPMSNGHEPQSHPTEGEVSELPRRRDPSLQKKRPVDRLDPRGVAWVRATDLVAQSTARWAGRGISFEAELARRMRRLPVQATGASRTAIAERARRLPPLSAFGRSGIGTSQPTRSGVGLR